MAVVMDALLTLTKEETQEFANGLLGTGLISLVSPNKQAAEELRIRLGDKSGRLSNEKFASLT